MTWRTVILTKDCRLSLRMKHLVVRNETTVTIPLNEIGQLIIENPNIVMTGHILNALSSHKITTILCDEKHMPFSHLNLIYGHHRRPQIIKQQIDWNMDRKALLWKRIVEEKIRNQQLNLQTWIKDIPDDLLIKYIEQIKPNDKTNREGHAAKVYFNKLFGLSFIRGADTPLNWALNYGYSLLLSTFTKTITTKGLLTEIGIHHTNQFNHQNLASDFMEVYRPLIDYFVKKHITSTFDKAEKENLLKIFTEKVQIKNKNQYLANSIDIYVDSLIHYLNKGDEKLLAFPRLLI